MICVGKSSLATGRSLHPTCRLDTVDLANLESQQMQPVQLAADLGRSGFVPK